MASVTYLNQPAIDKTKGAVPLVGTAHIYTVKKVLWHKEIESFLETLLIPKTLHVCSGHSKLGDVRLDNDPQVNPDIVADAPSWLLDQPEDSFSTCLTDPPYNGQMRFSHDILTGLARVASQRIIYQHWHLPANKYGLYRKAQSKFALSAVYLWAPRTYFGRVSVISVFDRRPSVLGGCGEDVDEDVDTDD